MNENMTLPNFLILGAPKAGTTALYYYLEQHPEIYMSPVKEPNFFAFEGKQPDFKGPKDDEAWTNKCSIVNLNDYENLFDAVTDEKAIGEASTLYLYIPQTAQRIYQYIPHAKLIAILRDPIERAFSHFLHLRRDRREWHRNFIKAISEEEQRVDRNWAPAWHYLHTGLYFEQIQRYRQYFSEEQFKIYFYEDWKNNPESFVKELFAFLGV
ncbi:MAG: sulfotransferase, partial [Cyanobacteria bacterium J007]